MTIVRRPRHGHVKPGLLEAQGSRRLRPLSHRQATDSGRWERRRPAGSGRPSPIYGQSKRGGLWSTVCRSWNPKGRASSKPAIRRRRSLNGPVRAVRSGGRLIPSWVVGIGRRCRPMPAGRRRSQRPGLLGRSQSGARESGTAEFARIAASPCLAISQILSSPRRVAGQKRLSRRTAGKGLAVKPSTLRRGARRLLGGVGPIGLGRRLCLLFALAVVPAELAHGRADAVGELGLAGDAEGRL